MTKLKDLPESELRKILENEDFINEILEIQTPEEVQQAFLKKGIAISLDEVNTLGESIDKVLNKLTNTEISAESLSCISGGSTNVDNILNSIMPYYLVRHRLIPWVKQKINKKKS